KAYVATRAAAAASMIRAEGPMPKVHGAIAALVLVCVTAGAAPPAPYTLEGSISDRLLRTPVAGAEITLLAARRSVRSSDDGSFRFGERPVQSADQLVIT